MKDFIDQYRKEIRSVYENYNTRDIGSPKEVRQDAMDHLEKKDPEEHERLKHSERMLNAKNECTMILIPAVDDHARGKAVNAADVALNLYAKGIFREEDSIEFKKDLYRTLIFNFSLPAPDWSWGQKILAWFRGLKPYNEVFVDSSEELLSDMEDTMKEKDALFVGILKGQSAYYSHLIQTGELRKKNRKEKRAHR